MCRKEEGMQMEREPRRVPDRRRRDRSRAGICHNDTCMRRHAVRVYGWPGHGHALCTSLLTCIWTVKGKAERRAGCYALWPPIRANRYSAPVHFLPVSRSRPIFVIMQMCAREVRAVFAHVLSALLVVWVLTAARAPVLQVIMIDRSLALTHFQLIFHFYKHRSPDPVWDQTSY